ncbi:carbohydrate ABC transporter permease [Micromonospora yangpuensis]|uniref:Carbohydrate ABC transporter membrane protein 1, CUT1 family (TC 3.A.1.1.-) n=1 Tax=Micromonospora yangpuensis TaxID=683228 RepID=A0A1C6UVQ2_9ACTN|nr:sugar ABC transporter permease [Micromonospora yangpuensis]GGM23684.1 sugar ABC transporter permease [Micromonospora yangpuensis]SCL57889.1 carbohydrate ABC transporter membrane protein 1, CUT1 family (TC 3.A.1.1.-) [Micromonospora yangpuensis]
MTTSSTMSGPRPGGPEAAPAASGPATRGGRPRAGRRLTLAVFLTPALLLFLLLVVAPIVVASYASLFKWNGFGLPENFVGLDNYTRAFADPVFRGDLVHGAILIVLSLVVQLPFAMALAMLLNQPLRGRAIYRVIFFAPYVLSEVTTAVLFNLVFSPNRGMGDAISRLLGAEAGAIFADPDTVLFGVFLVVSWKYFGLYMILFLAARQGIPRELNEAARTDGAGAWQAFRHVTLPLLGPTIRIAVFLSVIGAIQLFDMVWVLTGGGPIHASETMAVTMFQYGFRRFEVGYASAISIIMFLLSLVFALFYQRLVLRRDTEGALTTQGGQR